jgi:hypothetical protein
MTRQPSAICHLLLYDPFAPTAATGQGTVRPDVISSPAGAATAGAGDGVDRDLHRAHAAAGGAGIAGARVHPRAPAEGAETSRRVERPLPRPTAHLAGSQGGQDAKGISARAVAEGTGQDNPLPVLRGGLSFPANSGLCFRICSRHAATPTLASRRSSRSRSRRFSSSSWWAREER